MVEAQQMVTLLHRISTPAPKPPPAVLHPRPGDLGALSSVFSTVPRDVLPTDLLTSLKKPPGLMNTYMLLMEADGRIPNFYRIQRKEEA